MKLMDDYDKKYLKLRLLQLFSFVSDSVVVKLIYRLKMNEKLNLKNPETYNEKIQWAKINYKDPRLHNWVDKYAVRKYVEDTIGAEYLIPHLGVYGSVGDIDFSSLPGKYIMKLTNGSSLNYIASGDRKVDEKFIKNHFKKWLKTDYYTYGREWAYKDVPNRILCEELLTPSSGIELDDYRFFCFNGKVEIITVDFDTITDGQKSTKNWKRNLYDRDWRRTEGQIHYPNKSNVSIDITDKMHKMVELAEQLSKDIPAVRVDFYYFDDKIYFGELTFYHAAGFQKIHPESLDRHMGSLIDLNKLKIG